MIKKTISVALALVMSITSFFAFSLNTYAATAKYDEDFASENIFLLKNYLLDKGSSGSYGKEKCYVNSSGKKFRVCCQSVSKNLYFRADYGTMDYVTMDYNFPGTITAEVHICIGSSTYARTSVTFKAKDYDGKKDLRFTVHSSYGFSSSSQVQEYSNTWFQLAISGWKLCLRDNTPFIMPNIGFSAMCKHPSYEHEYTPATVTNGGADKNYCVDCGMYYLNEYAGIGNIELSQTRFTYDGKEKTPGVKVLDTDGAYISSEYYDVYYPEGRTKPGTYKVNIYFDGEKYQGTKELIFTIVCQKHKEVVDKAVAPTFKKDGKTSGSHCAYCQTVIKQPKKIAKLGKPALKKLTSGSKQFKATWKKVNSVDGYQIQYSTDSKFKKNKKSVTVKGNKNVSKTVKKLKSKKKYYVRIRAYKTINKKKQYSSWSSAKSIKIK